MVKALIINKHQKHELYGFQVSIDHKS